MDGPEFYRKLIKNYKDKTATDAELEVLMQLIREGKVASYLIEAMNEEAGIEEETTMAASQPPVIRIRRFFGYAAAGLLLLVFTGLFYYKKMTFPPDVPTAVETAVDIRPGGNHAMLRLGDGSVITLDSLENGGSIRQTGIVVRKTADGQIIYEVKNPGTEHNSEVSYNTISTPNGGQYKVILSDGTSVWLNAASSLRYPTRFTEQTRSVVLTGEGYFEVARDKHVPFVVECEKQMVQVLGTHFNINAYPDERSVNTTLLEGRVKVIAKDGKKDVELKPGEQATLEDGDVRVKTVDIEEAIDWKNGDFVFANEDIGSVMRKIARWYNVEVTFDNGFKPNTGFTGQVSRSKNIAEVLQVIELTGAVHFRIEGRRITVLP